MEASLIGYILNPFQGSVLLFKGLVFSSDPGIFYGPRHLDFRQQSSLTH